ncbi:hypothetical protein [Pantoea sp. BAV 3049]|uniref:hypothetical protein n=1 Tax=Pantoea sp. BAV 3049 TaxID=2654188 RepID=UPI001E4C9E63|nr:hypothetical protein [Pantoea sp. BAV 3049]
MIYSPVLISFLAALALIFILILLQKRGVISKAMAVVLAFVLIVVGNYYYFAMKLPRQQHEARMAAAQQRFSELPVYRTLKEQQPSLYQKLDREYLAALDEGSSEEQALERLRPMLSDLLNQRISSASDEALHRYMAVSLEEMKTLRQQNAELCFKFLFPQVGGGVNTAEIFPADLRDREMQTMDYFLQNSRGAEQASDIERSRADLQKIVRSLYGKWGSALQTMNAPAEPGADKTKLCDMTIDLYQSVLALPVNNSAGVLRIILAGNAN